MNKLFVKACKVLGIDSVNAELYFVGAEEIRELNLIHRGIDKPTDVLSFPMLDIKAGTVPCKHSFPLDINPETNKLELGDVIICKEYAELPVEVLAVHGFLHLLGYDHGTAKDAKIMNELTEKIIYEQRIN